MLKMRLGAGLLAIAFAMTIDLAMTPGPARGGSGAEIDRDVDAALASMYAAVPNSRQLGNQAKGVLVFPSIVKAGLIVGAQGGKGVMFGPDGKILGYYRARGVSYGMQAGAQTFSEAMFFMTDSAITALTSSTGMSVGVGPSVVVVDAGMARSMTTTTLKSDVYAFIFGQQGLMAGLGVQGQRIVKFDDQ